MLYSPSQIRELLDDLTVASGMERAEERADLLAAILALPTGDRKLVHCLMMGYSGLETAKKLGMTHIAASARTKQVLRRLAAKMNQGREEEGAAS